VKDLGVIVVDEEHESSYKQDEKPRYHARHAALIRARAAGAVAILGSATPDLESHRNGLNGRYDLVVLKDRPVGSLPVVELVDMRHTSSRDGFSDRLLMMIEGSLERERQVIIYYNRRGFARAMQCSSCGEAVLCPHCDIGLTVHLRPRRLLCHYCGFARSAPDDCPACGHEETLPSGAGTEKTELSLAAHFPEARILRLDHDTTRKRGSHGRILSAFASREADILVGTQMVAKGHHFPGVDLVGVLAADDGLHVPDFRAMERSFQLLSQVAGRTGREDAGTVVFQTWQPEHPIIIAAAAHDYDAFATEELIHREAVGYPPFRRMLRIGIIGRQLGEVESVAGILADLMRKSLGRENIDVLGPAPAVFARLQNRFRYQLLVKGELSIADKAWLADCLRILKERSRAVDVVLDFDPAGLW
jgi:primosomal protein N' (replication factor Y)